MKFANNKDNICCQKPSQSYSTSYYNSGNTTTTTTTLYPFNGLFSRITWVSWYQKGKTSLDLNEARDDAVWGCSGISGNIIKQSAPRSVHLSTQFFTGRMLFLVPNQQYQSTEGNSGNNMANVSPWPQSIPNMTKWVSSKSDRRHFGRCFAGNFMSAHHLAFNARIHFC